MSIYFGEIFLFTPLQLILGPLFLIVPLSFIKALDTIFSGSLILFISSTLPITFTTLLLAIPPMMINLQGIINHRSSYHTFWIFHTIYIFNTPYTFYTTSTCNTSDDDKPSKEVRCNMYGPLSQKNSKSLGKIVCMTRS